MFKKYLLLLLFPLFHAQAMLDPLNKKINFNKNRDTVLTLRDLCAKYLVHSGLIRYLSEKQINNTPSHFNNIALTTEIQEFLKQALCRYDAPKMWQHFRSIEPITLQAKDITSLDITAKNKIIVGSCNKIPHIEIFDKYGNLLNTFELETKNSSSDTCHDPLVNPTNNTVTFCDSKIVTIQNIKSNKPLYSIDCCTKEDGHTASINKNCIAVSSNNSFFITGSDDTTVKIWDTESGRCLHTLKKHTDPITKLILSNNNNILATTSKNGTLIIWNVQSGCVKNRLSKGGENSLFNRNLIRTVQTLTFSPNSAYIFALYQEMIKVWDTQSGKCLHTFGPENFLGNANEWTSLNVSSDSSFFIASKIASKLKTELYDLTSGKCKGYHNDETNIMNIFQGMGDIVDFSLLNSDATLAITKCQRWGYLWDTKTYTSLMKFEYNDGKKCAAISEDNSFLAITEGNALTIWKINQNKNLSSIIEKCYPAPTLIQKFWSYCS